MGFGTHWGLGTAETCHLAPRPGQEAYGDPSSVDAVPRRNAGGLEYSTVLRAREGRIRTQRAETVHTRPLGPHSDLRHDTTTNGVLPIACAKGLDAAAAIVGDRLAPDGGPVLCFAL